MNQLYELLSREIVRLLEQGLSNGSADWWQRQVLNNLSENQRRVAISENKSAIGRFDLAALLRILEGNWHFLAGNDGTRQGRSWIKELQAARNRWAHQTLEKPSPEDDYRDADTALRMLRALGARSTVIQEAERLRVSALESMRTSGAVAQPPVPSTNTRRSALSDTIPRLDATISNPLYAAVADLRTLGNDELPSAEQIWPLLLELARQRKLITYGDLAASFGFKWNAKLRSHLPRELTKIARQCEATDQPCLAALVVNKRTLLPGPGLNVFMQLPDDATSDERAAAFEVIKQKVFMAATSSRLNE